ncbi:MAG: hypothetical protein WDO24_26740 [Pseudomonadota bacterium]
MQKTEIGLFHLTGSLSAQIPVVADLRPLGRALARPRLGRRRAWGIITQLA